MMIDNIHEIEQRIQAACDRSGRDRSTITLIAVSKTKPNEMIKEAYSHGLRHFGENKVQELCKKREDLDPIFDQSTHWHLIGHLQTNKVKQVVGRTELIHSVDSLRLAQTIDDESAKKNIVSDILIEVNLTQEESKYGMTENELLPLIHKISTFSHIRIRGLMTIALNTDDPEENRVYFNKLRQLFIDIKEQNIDNDLIGNFDQMIKTNLDFKDNSLDMEHFNILSMGMTGDYEVAIEEGATMVRIGTGIFGERDYTKPII